MKTRFNPAIHRRRSIRKKGYDYSQKGQYFVTICCKKMKCLFGEIEQGAMILNHAGQMVHEQWEKLPERFPNVKIGEFQVMPNHFHGILEIKALEIMKKKEIDGGRDEEVQGVGGRDEEVQGVGGRDEEGFGGRDVIDVIDGATTRVARTWRLGDMVGAFKSIVAVEYIRGVEEYGWERFDKKLWHRNYFERIIRNRWDYARIAKYIKDNPSKWHKDKYNNKGK